MRIPHAFQRRVADLLLAGKSVILQAPTGAGKTFAAELPFIEAWEQGLGFPRHAIYAVPMRVLANQFVEQENAAPFRRSIQTGEQSKDPMFLADMTYATIDQVLSSFLMCPYSLSRRQANINAGAIASSYLVFDEFHLFDPVSTLPTALEMLRILRGVAPYLLMTATFSSDMLQGLADALGAVVVPETKADREAMQALASQQKTRRFHLAQEPLCAETVLAQHRDRTLVVCNTVPRAQALYRAICAHPKAKDTQVLLLHGRFLPEDRERVEKQVREVFAKGYQTKENYLLVATQVVEVGLDITCSSLHSELAPANAILQRAGRCARYESEEGDVHIYPRALDENGEEIDLVARHLPYQGMGAECQATRDAFTACDGRMLCFSDEQELVSAVHGPSDYRMIQGLQATHETHRRTMNAVLCGDRSTSPAQLIRDVSSQRVVVHDNPRVVGEDPFQFESFSLQYGTVAGFVKKWLARANEERLEEMGVYALHDLGDRDESGDSAYNWLPVTDPCDVKGAPLVMVHPRLATYDSRYGFLPNEGGTYTARRSAKERQVEQLRYEYQLESFARHAELTLEAARRIGKEMNYALTRLESQRHWPRGTLSRLVEMVALVHDVGKLNTKWQGWLRAHQEALGKPAPTGLYAHSDRSADDTEREATGKPRRRRPAHAVEGAVATLRMLLNEACEPAAKAALTAIARHHGAFANQFVAYRLEPAATKAVKSLVSRLEPMPAWGPDSLLATASPNDPDIGACLVDPQYDDELLAYAYLARILRLADQEATAAGAPNERDQKHLHGKEDAM